MVPPVFKIVETSLYVNDLELSESFYTGVLGLRVHSRKEDRDVFLVAGRNMLLLFNPRFLKKEKELEGESAIPQIYETSRTHIAFEIDPPDYDAWKAHLAASKVDIEQEVRWDNGSRSMYFRDPDGNVIELIEHGLWPVPPR
ncbi:MAG: VOC family protein [Thermoplasmata archaeon]|nr:VOC family protein [Candidatus Sysuiplasma acidicola]MBX8637842.1 VOC family protein [Candidatus Sysuiplasma acidicola]MBX8646756.1 VOC family protein [Candidatus Sysuiplasma acidicola]MDH2905972.1 VOC family protein [Methanomassiliicoccales archaeon]